MLLKDIDYIVKVAKKYKDFDFINFENLDIQEKEDDMQRNFEIEEDMSKIQSVINDDEEIQIELRLKKERNVVYR